ncbi:MAG: hypothetical protein B7Z80_02715 [Rhodospirillales bacterium 20-64-7]|nr:MAG: hypothetical protein B7Z80_02715 [Rhodospirillales bacterium 20-64-7]
MAKQVEENVPAHQDGDANQHSSKTLYMSVKTFDGKTGKDIGERIVDLYHFGTRAWLAKHTWWAMHNGHSLQVDMATDEEIGRYLFEQEKALQEKFNSKPQTLVAA